MLPIQRETATGYPFLPGSTLKGVLRVRARAMEVPAERLLLLGSDPALRERLGAGAREAALRFGWKAMVDAHSELYERSAV